MRHYHKEQDKVASLEGALRTSAFQVLSVTTTTGFATADFDLWPNFLRMMLVLMMFFGGCAGSTGGGIKMIRIMVVLKTMLRELKIVIQPRLITSLKISGQPMQEKNIINIMSFFITFVFLFGFFSLVMNFFIPDLPTAITSVVATLCNIGPGLCGVGSIENFDWIPITGKWILTLCMLIGRLEVFTVLIFLIPSTWKK
jgi:trk system potassium uptake protein TrkH